MFAYTATLYASLIWYCIVLCVIYQPLALAYRVPVPNSPEPAHEEDTNTPRRIPPNCIIWLICYQEQLKRNIHTYVQPQQLLPAHNMVAAEFYLKNNIFFTTPSLFVYMCHIQFFLLIFLLHNMQWKNCFVVPFRVSCRFAASLPACRAFQSLNYHCKPKKKKLFFC